MTSPFQYLVKGVFSIITLSLFTVSIATNTLAADAPSKESLSPEISQKLQAVLDTAKANPDFSFPGIILRIETPDGEWTGTAGVSNIETKAAIDPLAKFRSGSILKPFIGVVIMQLVEEGVLSLDDRMTDILDKDVTDLFDYSDQITVRMLLNHTSGMGEIPFDYETFTKTYPRTKQWTDMEYYAMASKEGSNFKPGEKWLYNNTEYVLLGRIIHVKTGLSWRENIRQRIFSKVEMKNTSLPEPGTITMPGSYIDGYEIYNGVMTNTTNVDPSVADAAGGHALISNAEDLAIFIKALLADTFFEKKDTLSTLLTTVNTGRPERDYALGVGKYYLPNGSYAYGHTGGTSGYATFMFHFPKEGITATSVITMDQGAAMPVYLLPALAVIAGQD